MGLMHADGPKNDNIDNAVFVNHIPLVFIILIQYSQHL